MAYRLIQIIFILSFPIILNAQQRFPFEDYRDTTLNYEFDNKLVHRQYDHNYNLIEYTLKDLFTGELLEESCFIDGHYQGKEYSESGEVKSTTFSNAVFRLEDGLGADSALYYDLYSPGLEIVLRRENLEQPLTMIAYRNSYSDDCDALISTDFTGKTRIWMLKEFDRTNIDLWTRGQIMRLYNTSALPIGPQIWVDGSGAIEAVGYFELTRHNTRIKTKSSLRNRTAIYKIDFVRDSVQQVECNYSPRCYKEREFSHRIKLSKRAVKRALRTQEKAIPAEMFKVYFTLLKEPYWQAWLQKEYGQKFKQFNSPPK